MAILHYIFITTKIPVISLLYSVRKKVSPKVFCHFLSNRSEFLHEISHILIHSHIKIAKQHCIILNCDKVIKFPAWPRSHFWCSRIVCRTKDASYFVMWHIKFVVIWTTTILRYLKCPSLAFMLFYIAAWSFTYQSCDRSLWLVIPDYPQCLPAHGGCVNNKCFIKSIKKLSMNISDKTYCLRSLLQFGVINTTIFLIYLF